MADILSQDFRPRVRPLEALAALLRFLRDKEATHEVFRILGALDGPVMERLFQRFAATEVGRRVLRERIDLAPTLADHAALAALPPGSLGRAYLDFVSAEDLSVAGFQAQMDMTGESFERAGEDRRRYVYRTRHAHDLWHVVTGYGRDFIGELALLAFSRQQTGSRGLLLIMIAGLFKAKREYPGLPVIACMHEGARLGRAAGDLVAADWERLLHVPLAEARRTLGVGAPRRYLAIQAGAEAIDRRIREELAAART